MKLYNPFAHDVDPPFFVFFGAIIVISVVVTGMLVLVVFTGLGPLLAVAILMALIARVLYFVLKGK